MNAKIAYIYLIIIIVLSFVCYGKTPLIIPKEFIERVPPKVGSNEWYQLNRSFNEFGVKIIDGQLLAERVSQINSSELKIEGGTLIGIDMGEWGGRLKFKPNDTTQNEIDIKSGNIKFIFSYKNKIYFIEGLAHLSISEGALYELDTSNGRFTFSKILDFEDAPEAYAIYKDKLFIATFGNFYVVKDFKKELVFENEFWDSLYPNSIAVLDERNVFLGIRGGIVKLDLVKKTVKFYKNDK